MFCFRDYFTVYVRLGPEGWLVLVWSFSRHVSFKGGSLLSRTKHREERGTPVSGAAVEDTDLLPLLSLSIIRPHYPNPLSLFPSSSPLFIFPLFLYLVCSFMVFNKLFMYFIPCLFSSLFAFFQFFFLTFSCFFLSFFLSRSSLLPVWSFLLSVLVPWLSPCVRWSALSKVFPINPAN